MATNAVYFDGSGDYGLINNFAGIDALTDGTYTCEMWMKQDTSGSPTYATFFTFGNATWMTYLVTENATSSTGVNFGYKYTSTNADGYKDTGIFTNNVWTHISVVFTNAAATKVYINGTEISYTLQRTPSGTVHTFDGANFCLARTLGSTSNDFKGYIGGFVRVWKDVRTVTELNNNKGVHITGDSDLIINLMFGEGSGTTLDNEATASADLTLTGTSTWGTGPDISGGASTSVKDIIGGFIPFAR